MLTEEQYEMEIERIKRNQRQIKPAAIFFIVLIVAEFILGGVLVPFAYNYGLGIIGLGIATCFLFGILLMIYYLEKKQLKKILYIINLFKDDDKPQKELDKKSREYKKKKSPKPYDLDELIEYDMVDEDFDNGNF